MSSVRSDNRADDQSGKGSVSIGLVLRGVRRYPLITFFFVIIASGAAAAVWFFLPLPKLTAYAIFRVHAQPDPILKPEGDAKTEFHLYRQTQAALVKSRPLLNTALSQPGINDLQILKKEVDKLAWLENQLKVDFKNAPELMRVAIEGDNADELKAIMEAITNSYIKDVGNRDRLLRLKRFEQLDKINSSYEQKLGAMRKRLETLANTLATTSPEAVAAREKHIQDEIGTCQKELNQLEREVMRAKTDIKVHEENIKNAVDVTIPKELFESAVQQDAGYQKLLGMKQAIQKGIDDLKKVLPEGATHKSLTEKQTDLAQIDLEIAQYSAKIRPSIEKQFRDNFALQEKQRQLTLQQQMKSKEDYRKSLQDYLNGPDGILSKAKNIKVSQVELEALKATTTQIEKLAEHIYMEMESMKPELESAGRVTVWVYPDVVPGIEGYRRLRYSLMAGFGMLLLGLGLVTTLEYRDRRIIHSDEVASGLGLRVIGQIPAIPRAALSRGTALVNGQIHMWHQQLTESVDNTRTLLLHSVEGTRSMRTIMVTSAVSGEGKTSLAGHLAVSLARGGFKTLLVDADLRRPSLHRVLGVPLASGLCELLRGQTTLERVIQPTSAPGLWVIAAGMWHPHLPQCLAGNTWRNVKDQLETEFDYIIVDTSPLLPVADALLLARHVDGVVLSLLHDVSQMGALAEAKERLSAVGTHILGVVISGVAHDPYGHSYYHYRGQSDFPAPASTV